MPDWREYVRLGRAQVERIPTLGWVAGGTIAVALAVVMSMEFSSPPYAALYEGLSPADGGKVIAQLQKLGIPYQLQAAGNIILVPAPQLADARLQLGAADVPQSEEDAGWDKLEDAPMTTSELAQNAMATRALEASLEQSIEALAGIHSAKVYVALPPDTPFLADQPKPTASVIITAEAAAAESQGAVIANLVSGAVPGLSAQQVSVETTSGVVVYPADDLSTTTAQFKTVTEVETAATDRISQLLAPLVGEENFRADVSANVDFTQEHIHQISYGPSQILSHQISHQSDQVGQQGAAIGIPGALSNEPPAATTAATPNSSAPSASSMSSSSGGSVTPSTQPHESDKNLDQTYVIDQSENDITKPHWVVNSIAISVVLNKSALGATSIDQVKAALAGAFAYPNVSVNVMAAPFQNVAVGETSGGWVQAVGPVSRALLEVLAAAALLLGLALPLGRRLSALGYEVAKPVLPPRPIAVPLPRRDMSQLRDQANANLTGVATLLQRWAEEDE